MSDTCSVDGKFHRPYGTRQQSAAAFPTLKRGANIRRASGARAVWVGESLIRIVSSQMASQYEEESYLRETYPE
jgi:hypothetical protein